MWDLFAIVLALLAIAFRWWDDPRSAGIAGYASVACSWLAARRARQHAATRAD